MVEYRHVAAACSFGGNRNGRAVRKRATDFSDGSDGDRFGCVRGYVVLVLVHDHHSSLVLGVWTGRGPGDPSSWPVVSRVRLVGGRLSEHLVGRELRDSNDGQQRLEQR